MSMTHKTYFDLCIEYNGYALTNELYEDEDCRKNIWGWGKLNGSYVEDVKDLKGLSSNSYATFEEAFEKFKLLVDSM